MEINMQDLEQKIQKIEERNQLVETNKAWETSWTRRILHVGNRNRTTVVKCNSACCGIYVINTYNAVF